MRPGQVARLMLITILLQSTVTVVIIWKSGSICSSGSFEEIVKASTSDQSVSKVVREDVTEMPVTRMGAILSFRFWEQQTQAMRNFVQLQCLAHSYGMRAVEPFLFRSFLAIPFDELLKGTNLLRFGQMVDLDLWNTDAATRHGYSPTLPWDKFLREAPRKIVVVCVRYRNPPHIIVPTPGFDHRQGCPKECFNSFNSSLKYLQNHGFSLLEKRCANFVDFGNVVTTRSFKQTLIGRLNPAEVTVIMTEFRGLFGLYRLPVLSDCGFKHYGVNLTVLPSPRISTDVDAYISSILKGQQYVAVLARVEKLVLQRHYNTATCTKEIAEALSEIYMKHHIRQRFLGMDVGKFGSHISTSDVASSLVPHAQQIFDAVYENRLTYREWENSFETIAYSNTPAYVANLQRGIAAKSWCLVMVGGGGFQQQALDFYLHFHRELNTRCVYKLCHSRKS